MTEVLAVANVELRKLSKKELVRLIRLQAERAERLDAALAELEEVLREDNIAIDSAGSLPLAAKSLEAIFEEAEESVREYLDNIQRQNDSREVMIEKAEAESRIIARKMIDESEERCREREMKTKKEIEELWAQLRGSIPSDKGSYQ